MAKLNNQTIVDCHGLIRNIQLNDSIVVEHDSSYLNVFVVFDGWFV